MYLPLPYPFYRGKNSSTAVKLTSPESRRRNEKHVPRLVEEPSQVVEPKDKGMANREMMRKLEDQSMRCQKPEIPESKKGKKEGKQV